MRCKQQLYGYFELLKGVISLSSFPMLKSGHIAGTPATVLYLKIISRVEANFEDGYTGSWKETKSLMTSWSCCTNPGLSNSVSFLFTQKNKRLQVQPTILGVGYPQVNENLNQYTIIPRIQKVLSLIFTMKACPSSKLVCTTLLLPNISCDQVNIR